MNARVNFLAPVLILVLTVIAGARGPRVLPGDALPADSRLEELRSLNSYHPFQAATGSAEAWNTSADAIEKRVRVAAGLLLQPTRTAMNAVVHNRRDLGDYSIENVYFESLPGHFVTGNLYRPAGPSLAHGLRDGARPGVLCPHGHWNGGRFLDQGTESRPDRMVNNALAAGAERFVSAARSPLQARCVQLARMGCIVFHYDMLANADSIQFTSHKVSPRKEMNSLAEGEWGFASPAAVARMQTSFGLQTWNSVRALDFLLSLEEADPGRILVTGASGGGTQTMMLTAVDDRITAAFPCVMPSTAMQGGCTCENSHFLRIGQGNIDISALTAPRPLGITAADDWTIELKTKGYPDLLKLYSLLGRRDRFEAHFDIHFKHNYNHVSRTHMYNFTNRHFGLGFDEPVLERDFEFQPGEGLTVWDAQHPAPKGPAVGDTHERAVCRWMTDDARKQVAPLLRPADEKQLARAREIIGGAAEVMVGRKLPGKDEVDYELVDKVDKGNYLEITGLVRNVAQGEEIPTVSLFPANWNKQVVLWIHEDGKDGLYDEDGAPLPDVLRLVETGHSVVGADLFAQGEFLKDAGPLRGDRNRNVNKALNAREIRPGQEWRGRALYTYGYNHTLFAQRVHDVLTLTAFIRNHPRRESDGLSVIGVDGAGRWVAAARAVAGNAIGRAAVDLAGFRFSRINDVWNADFVPGAAKYGDVAGFLVLSAPEPLWVAGAAAPFASALRKTYEATGAPSNLEITKDTAPSATSKAVDWILESRP